ncbi:MAG: accessory gene regulator B family protein [Gemmiger sp.]|nr:accessory gene regulator B family protein [Gemmiger sp.]
MYTLSNALTQYFIRCHILTPDRAQWCTYALQKRLTSFCSLCLLVAVGCLLAPLPCVLAFVIAFTFLRARTNGYHAKTFVGCAVVSALVMSASLLAVPRITAAVALILLFGGASAVLALAPVNDGALHLSTAEMQAMKRRVWVRLAVLVALALVCFVYAEPIAVTLVMAVLSDALLLGITYIRK